MRLFTPLVAIFIATGTLPAQAGDTPPSRTIELAVTASQAANNDMGVAELYAERSGADAGEMASQVNRSISAALETARKYTDVKVQTAGLSTWPVYSKSGGKIEAWRVRAEIRLESRNSAALSTLVGSLQGDLAVSRITMQPAPETQRKAADDAIVDALHRFEQRANLIASTLGKRHRIYRLNVAEAGTRPPVFAKARSPLMLSEAASAPIEAGESQVEVSVSGSIELLD